MCQLDLRMRDDMAVVICLFQLRGSNWSLDHGWWVSPSDPNKVRFGLTPLKVAHINDPHLKRAQSQSTPYKHYGRLSDLDWRCTL
jgi:hypothetical protein